MKYSGWLSLCDKKSTARGQKQHRNASYTSKEKGKKKRIKPTAASMLGRIFFDVGT